MSIKITEANFRNLIRNEYLKVLKENGNTEMSREGAEMMRDLAFDIAKKLAREIDTTSMAHRIDKGRLLSSVIDHVKLQMKE